MATDPDIIYSKYGRYARLSEIAVRKAVDLEMILNTDNKEALEQQIDDGRLLKALKAKSVNTIADLAYMCEKDGRINRLQRDDIARLIGFFDDLFLVNKEEIKKYLEEHKKEREKDGQPPQEEDPVDVLLSLLNFYWSFHNFEPGFYHYTHFDNFVKIMQQGEVLSRKKLKESNREFYNSASEEALARTEELPFECVRLFYAPKPPFLYVTEGIKPHQNGEHIPTPVLLIFDENIVRNENVHYLDMSGSHLSDLVMYRANATQDPREALEYKWDVIFSRGPLPKYYNNVESIGGIRNAGVIKAHRNAELLYPNHIETKYIKKIVFRTKASMKMAESILGRDDRFCVEEILKVFNPGLERKGYTINYLLDYNISVVDEHIFHDLEYKSFGFENYKHSLEVFYGDEAQLYDLTDIITEQCRNSDSRRIQFQVSVKDVSNINRINYYMNGHLSAVWIKGKEK